MTVIAARKILNEEGGVIKILLASDSYCASGDSKCLFTGTANSKFITGNGLTIGVSGYGQFSTLTSVFARNHKPASADMCSENKVVH